MKEILVSGNPTKDFERLSVNPILMYGNDKTEYKVYEVSDEDYETLVNEPDTEDAWVDCGWRYCEGSNQGNVNTILIVNNEKLKCWYNQLDEDEDGYIPEYYNLLEYLCEEVGASQFKNVCALTKDLAVYNNMSLSELFKKYQDEI